MTQSLGRILTTHVGSLPRNDELSDLLIRREEGETIDPEVLGQAMDRAVQHVVRKQLDAGIDIGNDGEQQRIAFSTYVAQRMSGFAGESKRRRSRDYEEFPELINVLMDRFPKRSKMQNAPEARSELRYLGVSAIGQEIDRVKRTVQSAGGFRDCFMTAPSPGIISTTMLECLLRFA